MAKHEHVWGTVVTSEDGVTNEEFEACAVCGARKGKSPKDADS